MIDFRYHLVSLISVFIALAIGIVLGAGAVGDTLSQGLAGQVEQLRTERDGLRAEAESNAASRDQLAGFIVATGPGIVSGTVDGAPVAMVTDSDTTRDPTTAAQELLTTAGAAQGPQVRLRPSLWSADGAAAREAALTEIEGIAPGLLPSADPSALAGIVGTLLTAPEPELTASQREAAWNVLEAQELVSISGDRTQPVADVLYLTAAPEDLVPGARADQDTSDRQLDLVEAQQALLDSLAAHRSHTVLAAATGEESAETASILSTVRADPTAERISTTDRLQEPDGPVLAVLALVEARTGANGDYGTAPDASSRVPRLPDADGSAEPAPVPAVSDGGGEG